MIKVILFDLGNVLAKPLDNHKIYEFLNPDISYQEFLDYWFQSKPVIDAHMGLVSDSYQVKKLIEYSMSSVSVEEFFNFYSSLDASFYEEVARIIAKLKSKYKVGLLSNLRLMDYQRYKDKLDKLNLDYLFLSYEMKTIKPNIAIYEKVINICKCSKDEILFFDDNKKNVDGAKEVGINAYQVTGANFIEIENIINNLLI